MIWNRKRNGLAAALSSPPDAAPNMAEMTRRLGLDPAPAAWPTDVSLLAQAIAACRRCDTAIGCEDWLKGAPDRFALPPEFCPNADAFKQAVNKKA